MQASTSIVLGVLAYLRRQGISRQGFLRQAEIAEQELSTTMCDLSLVTRVLCAGLRITRDPALALHLGYRAPTRMLDVVGDVLMHCPTLRVALSEAQRYLSLVAPVGSLHLDEGPRFSSLSFVTPIEDPDRARRITEIVMAFALRLARDYVGAAAKPIELRLAYEKPIHAGAYDELFACPVHFAQERSAILFESSILDEPQPFIDEPVLQLLKLHADERLERIRTPYAVATRVRDCLGEQTELSHVTLASTAKQLSMSERGLRRKLHEEGTSWTIALDEARREMALRKLNRLEIPIKQIADETGFSDPSAFNRAFRRWTGTTPSQYRAEILRRRGIRAEPESRPTKKSGGPFDAELLSRIA